MNEFIKKIPLNFDLMKNPVNWIIVWVMVSIGYYALVLLSAMNEPIETNED